MAVNEEELLDILQELVRPVLNKNNGETGTDLAQDLHSGRVEKRLRLKQPMVNLTMAELGGIPRSLPELWTDLTLRHTDGACICGEHGETQGG